MKQFTAFVRKEFNHILRDRRTILILLVMPIVQIILFGFAITTEVKDTPMAILDPSKDEATRQITEQLAASRFFTFVSELRSTEEVEKAFQKGDVKLVVVFSDNFQSNLFHTGEAAVQIIADASDPNQASTFTNYASNIITTAYLDFASKTQIITGNIRPLRIIPEIKMLYNPQMKGAYSFVPGVMGLVLVLICTMMTSISIVREKEMGTMEVLLVSPVKPIYILLAKITPYFALSVINLTSILLLSVFVLAVPIKGSLSLLILFSLLFIFVGLTLGLLVSNIVKTQVAAMIFSGVVMMMPTLLLSGMIFPIDSMPKILQWISVIPPNRWYIEGVVKLMIQGVSAKFVLKDFVILGLMAVLLLAVSLKKFNVRLSK
ncbi:MAG: ABC transporter permease [Bacteroidales bacterium]|jgi:ABC-2 type transport system permease protein|nr:ABC transporter permease [Bacteroidales bacterium]MDD3701084.1 ABC transporter permease [Bacteroidales bacterium]MDY0369278.1 ABC transporter permease [Bacteroidales bacterium]